MFPLSAIAPMDNDRCAAGIAKLLRDPEKMLELSNACSCNDYSGAMETMKLCKLME